MRHWLAFGFIAFCALFPLLVLAAYVASPGWTWPELVPGRFDTHAVEYLLSQYPVITRHMLSSVAYSLATVVVTFCLSIFPAHHFARHDFAGKTFLEGLLLAPALVPSMTFSMGVHVMFIRTGLADTFVGVVLALSLFSYPFMLRALVAGYQAVGEEYELCAANLGASRLMRLVTVEIPLLIPSVVAGASVVFLVAFSEYFIVFLIGGGAVDSYTNYLFPFLNSSDRSVGSLLTLVFLAVPVLLFGIVELGVSRVYRRRGMY
ncbi:ABC transporter permease [Salidesulfovibrio brasiliensis]